MPPSSLPAHGASSLLATLWPLASPGDSDAARRTKFVIRGAHFAMVFLVTVAVAGTAATHAHQLSPIRLLALAVAGSIYVTWSLLGTADAVRFVLRHSSSQMVRRSPAWPSRSAWRSNLHLLVQFALAEAIIWIAGPGGILGLLWIVLLPPIAYAVMYHRAPAIIATSLVAVALHTLNVVYWHGWAPVPLAIPGFGVAVLFTLVFTQIAVSAERARGDVERLADELRDANDKLRDYAVQAGELAATRERNRVAREIHDSLGHCLTVVHVQLEAARATFDNDRDGALDALTKAQAMTHSGLQEVRRSVSSLRTSPLHDRSLPQALQQLVSESRVGGLQTDLEIRGDARPLSPQADLTLYRAAQEGLTNTRKHAGARAVRLLLDFQMPDAVRLTISDDGNGAPPDIPDGFGLLGLRERVQLLGGQASIQTAPGNGFVLNVEIPA
jgi:signal transduction histidine kinase